MSTFQPACLAVFGTRLSSGSKRQGGQIHSGKLGLMRDEMAREEFTHLYREHARTIKRYALRQLNDFAISDDLVSETFLIAWRRWDDAPSPDRRLSWLYGIAYRRLANMRRSRDRQLRLEARIKRERNNIDAGDPLVDAESQLRFALSQLRPRDRELLEFLYWERLSYRDIATIMGLSENAVGIRISRARNALRGELSSNAIRDPLKGTES